MADGRDVVEDEECIAGRGCRLVRFQVKSSLDISLISSSFWRYIPLPERS